MRLHNPEIGVTDENKINAFIKVIESNEHLKHKHSIALATIDKIKASIRSNPEQARDLYAAERYSFKGSINNKNVKLRDDPQHNRMYAPNFASTQSFSIEPRKNFFEATELGGLIARILLYKHNKKAMILFANAFTDLYPQTMKKNARE